MVLIHQWELTAIYAGPRCIYSCCNGRNSNDSSVIVAWNIRAQCLRNQEWTAHCTWISLRIVVLYLEKHEPLTLKIVLIFSAVSSSSILSSTSAALCTIMCIVRSDVSPPAKRSAALFNVVAPMSTEPLPFSRFYISDIQNQDPRKLCSHICLERSKFSSWIDLPHLFHNDFSFSSR